MNGVGNHKVIEIKIPEPVANTLMRWNKLDNIGPARYATLDQLEGLTVKLSEPFSSLPQRSALSSYGWKALFMPLPLVIPSVTEKSQHRYIKH